MKYDLIKMFKTVLRISSIHSLCFENFLKSNRQISALEVTTRLNCQKFSQVKSSNFWFRGDNKFELSKLIFLFSKYQSVLTNEVSMFKSTIEKQFDLNKQWIKDKFTFLD